MEKQVRIILWALPRTLSTAFLKCMSGVPDSKMFYEPYTTAYLFGPDRPYDSAPRPTDSTGCDSVAVAGKPRDAVSGFDESVCTYAWVKDQLEAPFPGKQLIFCKDIAYCLNGNYEYLPQGYKCIFLIRHPRKVIPSWKTLISDYSGKKVEDFVLDELGPPVLPPGVGYGELLGLFEHVKRQGSEAQPIVIDADDLLADPNAVMSACCKQTGVPYTDKLLTWEEGAAVVEKWAVSKGLKSVIADAGSFDNVKKSSGFLKPDKGQEVAGSSELSPDVQRFVEKCMPLYSKLYEVRLKCD